MAGDDVADAHAIPVDPPRRHGEGPGDAPPRPGPGILDRTVGTEARKSYEHKLRSGFIEAYLSGPRILDIGYKGYQDDAVPIMPQAIGIDLDYPGYDGRRLPFPDGSQDAVYSSHCLEHIEDYAGALRDWFRVLRTGGFLIIAVPHQFLYERSRGLPSIWNADHKRFYTPASLLREVEEALAPNSYRIRHLADNDREYDYAIPPERHAGGCYEIELVVERIAPPSWALIDAAAAGAIEARRAAALDPPLGLAGRGILGAARRMGWLRRLVAPPGTARERALRAVYLPLLNPLLKGRRER